MGRLKLLGKGSKRPTTANDTPAAATPVAPLEIKDVRPYLLRSHPFLNKMLTSSLSQARSIEEQQQQLALDTVFSQPLMPCPLVEAPRIDYDPDMAIIISEEADDTWSVRYRGLVGTSYEDMAVLEQKSPFWLLDFLLGNRTSVKEPPKVVRFLLRYSPIDSVLTFSSLAVLRSRAVEGRQRQRTHSSRAPERVRSLPLVRLPRLRWLFLLYQKRPLDRQPKPPSPQSL
jgi:hypothetical protein